MSEETTSVEVISAATSYTDEDGEKQKVSASVSFDPGADLTSAVEMYGEDAVFERYLRGVRKDCGNAIRASLNKFLADESEDALEPDEIPAAVAAELADWRPDVSRRPTRKPKELSPEEILAGFEAASPEKQAEIIAKLQAVAAAAVAG